MASIGESMSSLLARWMANTGRVTVIQGSDDRDHVRPSPLMLQTVWSAALLG